jgi:hypothetical protein
LEVVEDELVRGEGEEGVPEVGEGAGEGILQGGGARSRGFSLRVAGGGG